MDMETSINISKYLITTSLFMNLVSKGLITTISLESERKNNIIGVTILNQRLTPNAVKHKELDRQ